MKINIFLKEYDLEIKRTVDLEWKATAGLSLGDYSNCHHSSVISLANNLKDMCININSIVVFWI